MPKFIMVYARTRKGKGLDSETDFIRQSVFAAKEKIAPRKNSFFSLIIVVLR